MVIFAYTNEELYHIIIYYILTVKVLYYKQKRVQKIKIEFYILRRFEAWPLVLISPLA